MRRATQILLCDQNLCIIASGGSGVCIKIVCVVGDRLSEWVMGTACFSYDFFKLT